MYMLKYVNLNVAVTVFFINIKDAWSSLGGVLLGICTTFVFKMGFKAYSVI